MKNIFSSQRRNESTKRNTLAHFFFRERMESFSLIYPSIMVCFLLFVSKKDIDIHFLKLINKNTCLFAMYFDLLISLLCLIIIFYLSWRHLRKYEVRKKEAKIIKRMIRTGIYFDDPLSGTREKINLYKWGVFFGLSYIFISIIFILSIMDICVKSKEILTSNTLFFMYITGIFMCPLSLFYRLVKNP